MPAAFHRGGSHCQYGLVHKSRAVRVPERQVDVGDHLSVASKIETGEELEELSPIINEPFDATVEGSR